MVKYVISRAINGISINGNEHLLDDNGKAMQFTSIEQAKSFLKENGYDSYTNEELEEKFMFEKEL